MRWRRLFPGLLASALLLASCGGSEASEPPIDPNCQTWFYPDRDGDGFAGSLERVMSGCHDPPEGYVEGYLADCDDGDPSVFRVACVDADGDGFTADGCTQCIGIEVPAGVSFSNRGWDCDDSDPDSSSYFGLDEDGDGAVQGEDTWLCAPTAPPGYASTWYLDCNDADPEVSPLAWESFSDELDSDCDGYDDPPVCTEEALAVLNAEPAVDACEGKDLGLLGSMPCAPCFNAPGQIVLRVVNQGSEPSPETTLAVSTDDAEADDILLPSLEPGEASALFTFVATSQVTATLATQDCNAENDSLTVAIRGTSCTR